jgi:hypothetical protein
MNFDKTKVLSAKNITRDLLHLLKDEDGIYLDPELEKKVALAFKNTESDKIDYNFYHVVKRCEAAEKRIILEWLK